MEHPRFKIDFIWDERGKKAHPGKPQSADIVLCTWSGGKVDDTSVVVGEIIEWTEAHTQIWSEAGFESYPLVFRSSAITF